MLEITLIRHGETEANASGRWQGHGDSPLSAIGEAQAAELGRALAEGPAFDAVYCSDLRRAVSTARNLHPAPETDPAWREIHVGQFEGLNRDEVESRFPGEVARFADDPTWTVGGGESWRAVQARTSAALATLRTRHPTGRVAVVSHGGVIISLCEHLLDLPWRSPRWLGRVQNTARAVLRFAGPDDEGRLARYNVVDHLSKPPALPLPVGAADGSCWVQTVIDPPRVASALGQPQVQGRLAVPSHDQQGQLLLSDAGATLLTWGVRVG